VLKQLVDDMLELVADWDVGSIVERRLDVIQVRRGGSTSNGRTGI
jgi:hypothetical protein